MGSTARSHTRRSGIKYAPRQGCSVEISEAGAMRFVFITSIILLGLTLGSSAQTFEQLKARAVELLLQHDQDKAKGVKTSWDEKDKAYQAGDLWLEAAKVASDDRQKFEAYDSAGEAYGKAQTLGKESLNAYLLARGIPSIPDPERARVGWEVARRSHQRSDYEFIVGLKRATDEQKAAAYKEIGSSYIVASKDEPKLKYNIVENYLLSGFEYAKFDARKAEVILGMATVNALEIPDQTLAVKQLDKVNQARLELPLEDKDSIHKAMVELSWAKSLSKLAAHERAASLWRSIGRNKAYKSDFREEAWLALADLYHTQKKLQPALEALDAAAKERSDNFVFSEKIANKRIALYDQAKLPADAAAVLKSLSDHPKASAQKREQLRLNLAQRLYQLKRDSEANRLLTELLEKPAQGPETTLQVTNISAQHAVDHKDLGLAREIVDSGLAQLAQSRADEQWRRLKVVSGNLYQNQQDYSAAFQAYSDSCQAYDGFCTPNNQVVNLTHTALKAAVQEKKLDQAKAIVEGLAQKWRVHPIIGAVFRARYQVAANDREGARQSLDQAKTYLNGLSLDQRKSFETEISEIEKALSP